MRTVLLGLLMAAERLVTYGQSEPTTLTMNEPSKVNLLHAAVKVAYTAWQAGDVNTWLSLFTVDATLYDDGRPRDFHRFVHEACGHERFTSIDKVEDDGQSIYGNFHTERWGDFRTYFKFHLTSQGKFDRLDIGQAN